MKNNHENLASLRIAHIASEVEPFSKTGGLASVLGSLPRAQKEYGVDAIIVTPYYEKLMNNQDLERFGETERIETEPGVFEEVSFRRGWIDGDEEGVLIYFIENKTFFGKKFDCYGAENDNARFLFFNIAALFLLKKIGFAPSVVHCHDWHAGMIPFLLRKTYSKDPFWSKTATLFTIHNLSFQLGHDWRSIPESQSDDGRSAIPSFADARHMEALNFAKRAVLFADAINTVSETYREEILTEDFGEGLYRLLKRRRKAVFGIVNGINYDDFNPLTDPGLTRHYSYKSVQLKKENKKEAQRYFGLEKNDAAPLLCSTSRISEQKGFKLIAKALRPVLQRGAQCIVMGNGDSEIIRTLKDIQHEFPRQFAYHPFDRERETLLYAGSDIFLLPSRFEPCGINQMIALRYGCIPVVRHIGGLADTIEDYDPRTKKGNGFVFQRYHSVNLLIAMVRAMENFKHKRAWRDLMVTALREANSWKIPAQKYIDLYADALKFRRKTRKNSVESLC